SGSTEKTIKIWDIKTGKLLRSIAGQNSQVNALAITPDGQTLVSVGSDKLMELWNIQTGSRILTRIPDKESEVNVLAFSRDGQILVTGSNNGTIRLWNRSTLIRKQTLQGHTKAVNAIAISPDNQILARGSNDGTVKIWDLNETKEETVIKLSTDAVKDIVFSADRTIVIGGDKITILDVSTKEKLKTFFCHSGQISSLAITPDGKTLVTGSLDKTIKVWRMP
ncbi:MAG: WD40 repeat domain-containing protein, partial [Trichodesmium sp. St7_bin2_1]|nr:WD40 repeat domain-containing protein [Trichodesmium sp. St7_bin2_1]